VRAEAESGAAGRLKDGTPGRWFRFLGSSHLVRTHGWTLAQYREAFELRANVPTCSEQLSAALRAHTLRRIDADEFGARYLPAPEVLAQRRAPLVPRWRSLAVRHPDLVEQLHPTLNGRLDPLRIAAGSNRKLWWRCPRCEHAWQSTVHNRTAGWGCPQCAARSHARRLRKLAYEQARVPPERSLALKQPELLAELHPTRNRGLDPNAIGYGSQRKLWWCCPDCGHEWTAAVASRTIKGSGCRRCFMNRHRQQLAQRNRERPPTVPIERSLAVKHPELLPELHPTLNGDLNPYAIGASSHRRLWWRCRSRHEWQTTVNTSSRGCGCPACASGQSGSLRSSMRAPAP